MIQRGNNREFIFKYDDDKGFLISQLRDLREAMGYKVYGFVLMENHYHLILQTLEKPLQSVMQRVNYRYSKYYNKKYGHYGHVFAGRYKAIPVMDEKYLLSLIRYVHQNPVRAGICLRVEDYRWSSDCFYRANSGEWVDVRLVLDMLSADSQTAIGKYMNFMAEEEKDNYGDRKVIGQTAGAGDGKETIQINSARKGLDEILLGTGVNEKGFELIKKGPRKRDLTGYKLLYVKEALQAKYTLKAIGENIQVSDAAVLEMLRRHNLIT